MKCLPELGRAFERAFEPVPEPAEKDWAVRGDAATRENLVTSIFLEAEDLGTGGPARVPLGAVSTVRRVRASLFGEEA